MTALAPQPSGIPTGVQSKAAAPYWDACRQGELLYQRCDSCAQVNMKPARSCGSCGGTALTWEHSEGRGTLYSWTVVWRPQHPSFQVPYAPAVVELDEGFWMLSAVIGCEPDELRAGLPLVVEFHAVSDEVTLPYFRPA